MSSVARRYARALVDVVAQTTGPDSIDEAIVGLRSFRDLCSESVELGDLMTNPVLRRARQETLDPILERLALPKAAASLVRLLADNDRFGVLDAIVAEAQLLSDARAGRERATVVSAIPLDAAQTQRVAKALGKRVGHPVSIEVEVDPAIRGGLMCRVGDMTIDTSVKRQLDLLHDRLTAEG